MSQSNMKKTHDSRYPHNGTQAVGSVLDSVKESCYIAMHGCSPSYIISNTFTPLYKSLRRSGNTDPLGTLPSTQSKTMDPHRPTQIPLTSAQNNSLELTAGVVSGLQDLSIVDNGSHREDDDYEVHDDEFVTDDETESLNNSDDSDELDEEELETVFGYRVDLVAQERQHKRKPIYTRALLNDVRLCAGQIRREFSSALDQRELHHLDAYGLNQKSYRVWESDNSRDANYLQVEYLSRVEMHPDFQRRYGEHSDQIRALRGYNEDCKNDCIDTPYTFITFDRQFLNEHRNNAKMREYWNAISCTKGLWIESFSRRKLRGDFRKTAEKCALITQVVCFGLGALNLKKNFYHSAIQYMAVFSIIQTLNEYYGQNDPNRTSIKLVLQDPNYEVKDHQILRRLFKNDDNISFVSDSEGLLAIDTMPLVQIIADLFSADPTQGPAAMICDIMEVDTEKREYSLSDRAPPAAARFLTSHYEKTEDGFEDHGLEDELMVDAYGEDWEEKNRLYWLNKMDLWMRKIVAN